MIRKLALYVVAVALIIVIAWNALFQIKSLRRLQYSAVLANEASTIRDNISALRQDLADMEADERGYLLTADVTYLQPYTEAKLRLANDLAGLRTGLADRNQSERSLQSQLESLAGSRQAELEHTISLRQQGYRHRAFLLVGTNEGKQYMDRARELLSTLAAQENSAFVRYHNEYNGLIKRASQASGFANLCLFILAGCLFGLIHSSSKAASGEAAQSREMLAKRDSQLEHLMSALADQTRSNITAIENNAKVLLDNYGDFLPRHGYHCAEQIQQAATEMERLRKELLHERVRAA
ncbi:MAG: CHASE3 domain-containing protein [Acidobacteria bacterium]|nr:CHASE3 domain-containing protein [Acidobacteriota bacterium]